MRALILSAGPHLLETYRPIERMSPSPVRIAVNSAAEKVACDYWCCGDGQTFARIDPRPRIDTTPPTLFTITDSDSWFRRPRKVSERFEAHRRAGDRPGGLRLWGPVARELGAPNAATSWSVTAALMLAVHLGARDVEVHGHYHAGDDPANTTDCAGFTLAKRIDTRPRVLAAWHEVRRWAQSRGVRVVEVTPVREVVSCT